MELDKKHKTIAILTAGGVGQRMNQDIPKQFLTINDKPAIIYTLEKFQKHPEIDHIVVVCLAGWEDILLAYTKQFNITKLLKIVQGGKNGQESIKNGLDSIKDQFNDSDFVVIHDGNRPNVSQEIISDSISKCKKYGNGVAAIPCAEAMLITDDRVSSTDQIDRSKLMRTQTPQTYRISKISSLYDYALKNNIDDCAAPCALCIKCDEKIYFSVGSEKNIKLTTVEDIEIFKALLNTEKDEWLK